MRMALWSLIFFLGVDVVAADALSQELTRLGADLKLIDRCFEGAYLNMAGFIETKNDPRFKTISAENKAIKELVDKIDSSEDVTKTNFIDALIDEWFLARSYPVIAAGDLPEDGHDVQDDFIKFAADLSKCMKDYDRKIDPCHAEWKKFFSKPRTYAQEACPLQLYSDGSYRFVDDQLLEYFIARQMLKQPINITYNY